MLCDLVHECADSFTVEIILLQSFIFFVFVLSQQRRHLFLYLKNKINYIICECVQLHVLWWLHSDTFPLELENTLRAANTMRNFDNNKDVSIRLTAKAQPKRQKNAAIQTKVASAPSRGAR